MEISKHIDAVERNGALLADAAAAAGLTADVPACPGWQVRDLVRHQAYVHSWATRHVIEESADFTDEAAEDEVLRGGPPDENLLAAYSEGVSRLVAALRDADPAVPAASFMQAPYLAAFWARRQAHETAIHRFDAQAAAAATGAASAAGAASPHRRPLRPAEQFDPAFAADGIDELLTFFSGRRRSDGSGRCVLIRAADTGDSWRRSSPPEGRVQVTRPAAADPPEPADCTLSGPASGLYLLLWNRCTAEDAAVTVAGDPAILHDWNSSVRIRWD